MQARWLAEGPEPGWPEKGWPGKAEALSRLAQAGLRVPRALVLPLRAAQRGPLDERVDELLRQGPLIARSALSGEDTATHSAAGLGESRSDLATRQQVGDALREMERNLDDRWLEAYRGGSRAGARTGGDDWVILQRRVERRALVVAALALDGELFIEVHDAPGDVLAQGSTPGFAGRVQGWADPTSDTVEQLCRAAGRVLGLAPHGLDLELVVDPTGDVFLVQARPITAPLQPGWDDFLAELGPAERAELHGTLVLDAEHNPAPLSFAHGWVMKWLAEHEPRSGRPTILAGWLYVRTLVRHLADDRPSDAAPPLSVHAALETLRNELLPQARARLSGVEARLRSAPSTASAAEVLNDALEAFGEMIRVYIEQLVPARAAARSVLQQAQGDPDAPLTMRDRASHADVLPASWDIASPSLAELLDLEDDDAGGSIPTAPGHAALLLGEWDDHLFALGLAPLRRVWVEVGRRLGLGSRVFMLEGPELLEAARTGRTDEDLIRRREATHQRREGLAPPHRIEEGRPIPVPPSGRLVGIAVGPSFEGPLTHRRDLEDLLARPPGADCVVTLPALTAQAAVALVQTGLRAVCCEHGGAMSHATLMVRELGLSALIGCRGCRSLPEGTRVRLDTKTGRLRPLST